MMISAKDEKIVDKNKKSFSLLCFRLFQTCLPCFHLNIFFGVFKQLTFLVISKSPATDQTLWLLINQSIDSVSPSQYSDYLKLNRNTESKARVLFTYSYHFDNSEHAQCVFLQLAPSVR